MTIYKRPDNTIFAESAQSGEVVAFENMPRGWGVTLDTTKGIPPMEWFNFLQNRTDKAIQYILQNGITEYDTNLEYPQNAVVKSGGKLYLCLRQNTNKPLSNGAYWELLIKNATTSQKGVVQLSSSVTSADETKASTPKATKTAYDKAVQAYDNANKAQQRADSAYSLANTKENKITRSDSVTSSSSINVATSKAVKTAHDNANSRVSKSGDEMSYYLTINSTHPSGDCLRLKSVQNQDEVVFSVRADKTLRVYQQGVGSVYFPSRNGTLALKDEGVPVGAIITTASNKTQKGYLKCDGGFYSTTTYAELFAEIGYTFGRSGDRFAVPDPAKHNKFLRCAGGSLSVGTYQTDTIRNIRGTIGDVLVVGGSRPSGAFTYQSKGRGNEVSRANELQRIILDVSKVVDTSNEVRPHAIAVAMWIKY